MPISALELTTARVVLRVMHGIRVNGALTAVHRADARTVAAQLMAMKMLPYNEYIDALQTLRSHSYIKAAVASELTFGTPDVNYWRITDDGIRKLRQWYTAETLTADAHGTEFEPEQAIKPPLGPTPVFIHIERVLAELFGDFVKMMRASQTGSIPEPNTPANAGIDLGSASRQIIDSIESQYTITPIVKPIPTEPVAGMLAPRALADEIKAAQPVDTELGHKIADTYSAAFDKAAQPEMIRPPINRNHSAVNGVIRKYRDERVNDNGTTRLSPRQIADLDQDFKLAVLDYLYQLQPDVRA